MKKNSVKKLKNETKANKNNQNEEGYHIDLNITKFMLKSIKGFRFFILSVVAITIMFEMVHLTVAPYILKSIFDIITENVNNPERMFSLVKMPLIWYLICFSVFPITSNAIHFFQIVCFGRIQRKMRKIVFNYTQKHSYKYFQDNMSGSLANKVNDVVNSCEKISFVFATEVISIIVGICFLAFWTRKIDAIFSLIFIVWTISFILLNLLISLQFKEYSKNLAESKSKFTGKVVDALTNIFNVKNFARERYENSLIADSAQVIYDKNKSLYTYKILTNVFKYGFCYILIISNYTLAIYLRYKGILSVGDVIFIIQTSNILMWTNRYFSDVLMNLFEAIGTLKQGMEKLFVKREVVDNKNAKDLIVKKGKIEFKKVTFNYSEEGTGIFNDLSITIKPGERIGLVGFSGAGKSTFVNLLLRYFDIKDDSGNITIDNQDISKVTQESLRNHIALIPQESSLFHRSIMENIRYGKLDATDEEVMEAAKKAHCHEFIGELKEGYGSLVGERGVKLSGGQRQRIAIARAILKDAPILILDEATSSLDTVTERCIQDSMQKLMEKRTVIAVAHRLSTLQDMDRILVFDKGAIIENGSHDELVSKKDGRYAQLWKMQLDGFIPEDENECPQ